MKKLFTSFMSFIFLFGCSTNNGVTSVVPAAPTNLTGVVVSITQVNLTWIDNSTNESGYKIQRKTDTGTFSDVASTGVDIATFSDQGLTPNTSYTYRVFAYNSAGNSLQHSNEVTITTSNYSYTQGPNVTDVDGNVYSSFTTSCGQTWTSKNLNVSTYRNGDVIPQVTDPTQWANLTTGAWCWYNNDSTTFGQYGKLYNCYAVKDPRGLAPIGWHIPSDAEWWDIFIKCIDPSADTAIFGPQSYTAGANMKSTSWAPNGTNTSGFNGLPGGTRYNDGTFGAIGSAGGWWSSTADRTNGNFMYFLSSGPEALRSVNRDVFGLSVRVVRD